MSQRPSAPHPTTEHIRTHAERMAHEAEERVQERLHILAEQHSSVNPPDVRIRAWEKAHALRMPSDPDHPVLLEISIRTGLTIAQVQEEQRARRARRVASAEKPGASSTT